MSRVNALHKVSASRGDWRRMATPVIIAVILGAVAIGLVAFLLTRESRPSESQVQSERRAVASSSAFKVTVRLRETATIGDVSITLTDLQQQPDTKKYKVWATVAIKGQQDMQIRRAEEGAAVIYPEEHGYTIELIQATAEWAKFAVTKNP